MTTDTLTAVGDLAADIHAAIVTEAGWGHLIEDDTTLGIARLEIDQTLADAPDRVRRHLVCWLACKVDVFSTIHNA